MSAFWLRQVIAMCSQGPNLNDDEWAEPEIKRVSPGATIALKREGNLTPEHTMKKPLSLNFTILKNLSNAQTAAVQGGGCTHTCIGAGQMVTTKCV